MQNQTNHALRDKATTLLGSQPITQAKQAFLSDCVARFNSNPEGLSKDEYLTQAEQIWSDIVLQHNARPNQSQQGSHANR